MICLVIISGRVTSALIFVIIVSFALGRHDETFAAQAEESFRFQVFSDSDELPSNVWWAFIADADLPSISGEPGKFGGRPVNDPGRVVNSLVHSQCLMDISSGIAVICVHVAFCHRKYVRVAGDSRSTAFAVEVAHLLHKVNTLIKLKILTF